MTKTLPPIPVLPVSKLYSLNKAAYTSHVIHRKMLDSLMEREWQLDTSCEVLADAIARYYLLYWNPMYLTKQIKDGILENQGTVYRVIYTNTWKPNADHSQYRQIALSFRTAKPEYGIYPKVLVRGIKV